MIVWTGNNYGKHSGHLIALKNFKMIQLCNSQTYSKVKLGNEVSISFETKSGL